LALPLAALLLGLASNAIDGNRLNILAFPLLAMLAWNLAVYALLIVGWLRHRIAGRRPSLAPPLIGWLLRPASSQLAGHPTLERAVVRSAATGRAVRRASHAPGRTGRSTSAPPPSRWDYRRDAGASSLYRRIYRRLGRHLGGG
jgi:hypothetical protein